MTGVAGVVTTGIYCLPTCSARPRPENVRTFRSGAAAEAAGYRACLLCRPYRAATPEWTTGPQVVCRAVRMIVDGVLDERGEAHLAAAVGVSGRHLRRLFAEHVGTTPDQLARSRRAHFARRLLDDTDLSVTDVAFASGFGSVRQLDRACAAVFRAPPTQLRARRRRTDRLVADGGLCLRLPYEGPLDFDGRLDTLRRYAVPGVEHVAGHAYRRTIRVGGAPGVLEIEPGGADHLLLRAHLPHWQGLIHLVRRVRRMFALDGPAAAAWDPYETSLRAVLDHELGAAEGADAIGRLAVRFGARVPGLEALGLTHTFPPPDVLAAAALELPAAAAAAVRAFAACGDAGDTGARGGTGPDPRVPGQQTGDRAGRVTLPTPTGVLRVRPP